MASYLLEISYSIITVGFLSYFLARSQDLSKKKLLRHWILFGFLFNIYGLSWLYTAYPLSWITPGFIQLFGITLLLFILASFTALGYSVIAYSFHTKIQKEFLPFVFALSCVIAEILRSLILSFLFLGKGTTVALHFTAGTIGGALSTTPFIEFAYFGGTFALTFVLSYLVYIFNSKKNIQTYWKHSVVFIILLACTHFFIPIHHPQKPILVGVITTNFLTPKDGEYTQAYEEEAKRVDVLTRSLSSSSPSIIVYPEDTRYLSFIGEKGRDYLIKTFSSTLFIDGDTLTKNNTSSNVSFFYYPKENHMLLRGKEFLLPFNEYIPFFFRYIFGFFISKDAIDSYSTLHTYTPVYSDKVILFKGLRVGTLLCSEITSFSVVEKIRKEKPDIIFFQSRLNTFHNNPWFIMNLRSFTKIAAAELRTPLISSTSDAPSFVVSPYGKILHTTETGWSTSTYLIQ